MFSSASTTHDLAICLKCRYRIAAQLRLRPIRLLRSPYRTPVPSVSGFLTSARNLRQLSPETGSNPEYQSVIGTSKSGSKLRRMKSKVPLETSALGEPGEVLLLGQDPLIKRKDYRFEMKETVQEVRAMDHLQMVDTIDAEREAINPELVSKNLDEIKAAWLDSASKVPTALELGDLADTLHKGFTEKQLRGYLEAGNRPIDYLDLRLPYSSPHYRRSSWSIGTTAFPGHGSSRLITLNAELDAFGEPRGPRGGNKSELINKILVQQWRLLSGEELGTPGELDIWLSRQQLDLLLNHRGEILYKLAEEHSAKIEASRSHGMVRVTADFQTCGSVLKSIDSQLKMIFSGEMDFSHDRVVRGGVDRKDPLYPLSRSLLNQVERLTSTIIENPSCAKLCIYYIGPGDDDLEDARRLISQTLHPATLKKSKATCWHSKDSNGKKGNFVPEPIETRGELPFVARGIQWSRWIRNLKTTSDKTRLDQEAFVGRSSNQTSVASNRLMISYLEHCLDLSKDSFSSMPEESPNPGAFWDRSRKRRLFAVLGYIIYPRDEANEFMSKFGRKGKIDGTSLSRFFNSQREWLTTFHFPRSFLQYRASQLGPPRTEFQIKLKPSQELDEHDRTGGFPTLALWVRSDEVTKKVSLDRVELIVEEEQFDLLRPDDGTDIRFCTEFVVASGDQFDPRIAQFIASSNLGVFGQEGFKTPTNLTVPIPAHAIRKAPSAAHGEVNRSPVIEGQPDVLVDYTFASLERRCSMAGLVGEGKTSFRYTMIEPGRSGGGKQEVRMIYIPQGRLNHQNSLRFLVDVMKVNHSIGDLGPQSFVFPTSTSPPSPTSMSSDVLEIEG